jgi:hypothetical protein
MTVIDAVHSLSVQLGEIAEHYVAADPDAPAWEAEQRARRVLVAIAALTAGHHDGKDADRAPEAIER